MTIASVVQEGTVALCASAPFFCIIFFVSVCCVFCVCVLFTKALRSPPLLFLILLLSLCESVSCSVYVYVGSEILGQETPLLELRLQVLVEQEDSELLHHAALLGNLSVIREYLDKYPNEVSAPFITRDSVFYARCTYECTRVWSVSFLSGK